MRQLIVLGMIILLLSGCAGARGGGTSLRASYSNAAAGDSWEFSFDDIKSSDVTKARITIDPVTKLPIAEFERRGEKQGTWSNKAVEDLTGSARLGLGIAAKTLGVPSQ